MFGEKWDIPVSDNLKVTVTGRCNLKNQVMDPANSEWSHGVGLEFTL
jgi:hypothetical protein